MAKYHVNPNTGVPGVCTAKSSRCPFGGDDEHYDSSRAAVEALEERLEEEERLAALPQSATKTAPPAVAGGSDFLRNTGTNSQISIVKKVMAGPGRTLDRVHVSGSKDSSFVHPLTGEGDRFGYTKKGLSILAESDGKRIRAFGGDGAVYADPGAELGRPVTLTKYRSSGSVDSINLHLVGYVDGKGNRYGFVPDKKIQYFVSV